MTPYLSPRYLSLGDAWFWGGNKLCIVSKFTSALLIWRMLVFLNDSLDNTKLVWAWLIVGTFTPSWKCGMWLQKTIYQNKSKLKKHEMPIKVILLHMQSYILSFFSYGTPMLDSTNSLD